MLVLVAVPWQTTAASATRSGTIVLTCEECGGLPGEVWEIRPDGHRIGPLFGATGTVRFSPDGTQIAYAVGGRIAVSSRDGRRSVALTLPPGNLNVSGDSDPAWLDGRTLVFVRSRQTQPTSPSSGDNVTSLETISVRPRRPARLLLATPPVQNPPNVVYPDVSRNGTIAFGDNRGHLWAMTLHKPRHALASSDPYGFFPRWSPDGTRVAFLLGHDREPAVLDVSSGRIRTLAVGRDRPTHASALGWSPDGRRLAVGVGHSYHCGQPRDLCEVGQLWIVDLKTGAARKVFTTTEYGNVTSVDWTA